MQVQKKAVFKAYTSAIIMTIAWFSIASMLFAFVLKNPSPVPIFIIFCFVQISCMSLFAIVPGKGKTIVRIVSMFIIGSFLMVMAGILGRSNLQVEGFFFSVISGTMGGAIVHFAMAKIAGPLFYNRNWCSWGCWTSIVLDLLPYKSNISWKKGTVQRIRYYHFALSFIIVVVLYYGYKYSILNTDSEALKSGIGTKIELIWFLTGNALYYLLGISFALILKDNRAFCKYVCPITVFYKTVGRFSLLRIKGDRNRCTNCNECVSKCPMAIDIPKYIKNGERVKSSECIMCMNCIATCPNAVLKTSVGFDFAGKDHLFSLQSSDKTFIKSKVKTENQQVAGQHTIK
jgi:polyferredoxin